MESNAYYSHNERVYIALGNSKMERSIVAFSFRVNIDTCFDDQPGI